MKTFMLKPADVERKWYVVNAKNIPLGRLASQVADMLSGKNKPTYTPNVDCGDFVIVLNSDDIVLTGKKLIQKELHSHSGFAGHLKSTQYKTLIANDSDIAIITAIKGMLPKNKLRSRMLTRLHVYKGAEHENQAQQPIEVTVKGAR